MKKKCLFFHKWKIDRDTGFTTYKRCEKCGIRTICQDHSRGGHQPIDIEYLNMNIKEFILERSQPDGNNFKIDVSNYSFVEVVDILKEKAVLGGVMCISNDDVRLIVDNGKFYGSLQNLNTGEKKK